MNFPNATESLRDIVYFVTTAKSQSITAAAEELGMSKSAIGKSISRLETQLGSALFNRNTRRIRLTTEGEMYLQSCINALDILYAAENELLSKSQAPSGVVRIDMPAAFGRSIVLPVLLEIGQRYPEIKYILTFNDKVIDPMGEGFDLAFRFGAMIESSDLVARPLNEQQLVLCAAPSYLASRGMPTTIGELEQHQCIVAWRAGKPLSWLLSDENQNEFRLSPLAHHEISDGDAMVTACVSGAGIIQFPQALLRKEIEQGRLVEILSPFNPKPTELHILWPRKRHLMPGIRYIIDEFLLLAEKKAFS
jgi:DNA-binding transcriptional LysR family regulator